MDFAVSYRYQSLQDQLNVPLINLKVANHTDFQFFRRAWTTRLQRNTPGLFFFSSTGQLVYHESYLERQILLCEDFQHQATWVIDQPFQLHFEGHRHVPDFLVLSAHQPKVIDVRHSKFLGTERFVASRNAMEEAMEQLGWTYEVRSEPAQQFFVNLDWLSGFRRTPPDLELFAPKIYTCLESSAQSLKDLLKIVGHELFSRPVVFYLIWKRILEVDLYAPFSDDMEVDLGKEVLA
jgi:hypothetical protein